LSVFWIAYISPCLGLDFLEEICDSIFSLGFGMEFEISALDLQVGDG
jgi:hypothetical protein